MNNNKKELKEMIEKQKEENVRLFKIFEYKMHKDEMQPLIQEWREGSKKLKELLNKLYEIEKEERELSPKTIYKENKTFVNGFGEATTREITTSSYKRNQKRLTKDILNYIK